MNRVLLPFPPQRPLAQAMAPTLHARVGRLDWRRFPDGESLVTLDAALDGAHVAIVASLDRADRISVPLRFAADTARELGARSVGLVAPYLGYMRQDARFHAGEAVGARSYARFLQQAFDWLATVDPHLHRIRTLAELFAMPATQVSAAPLLAQWIRAQVRDPVVVGPDAESAQWVAQVATACDAPWLTLRKQRRGDRDVAIDTGADLALLSGRSLVLVDDIVSTGETLVQAIRQLQAAGPRRTCCLVIHPVFAQDAYARLRAAGADCVASTDTIAHASNAMSVAGVLAQACSAHFARHEA